MPSQPKVQRWTDLLAALLRRNFPVDFATLRQEIPAYSEPGRSDATTMRMFERDKDELRTLGVPLETIGPSDGDDEPQRYRIDPREMYLPFLAISSHSAGHAPPPQTQDARRLRSGYRSIPSLELDPDELTAIVNGHAVCALIRVAA